MLSANVVKAWAARGYPKPSQVLQALPKDAYLCPFCKFEYTAGAKLHPNTLHPPPTCQLYPLDFLGRDMAVLPSGLTVLVLRERAVRLGLVWNKHSAEKTSLSAATMKLSAFYSLFIMGGCFYPGWLESCR